MYTGIIVDMMLHSCSLKHAFFNAVTSGILTSDCIETNFLFWSQPQVATRGTALFAAALA